MNASEILVKAIDRAITGAPPKNTTHLIYELFLVPNYPKEAITKQELAGLHDDQKRWLSAFTATRDFDEQAQRRRWAQDLANPDADHLNPTVRTRSLESRISEGASKVLVGKSKMAEASCSTAKRINVINQRLFPLAEKLLVDRQKSETDEAERYGLTPTPTALTAALKGFVNMLRVTHVGAAGSKPSDMCPFITIN